MYFSVIVPVYKVEKYLNECVDSILSQSFKDFELILVDDGSPDNCPGICDEYSKIDSRVKVIHKGNGGQSSARNEGIYAALGQYLIFLDSDDYILRDDFFSSVKDSICDDTDIILFKYQKFFDKTKCLANCAFSLDKIKNESSPKVILPYLVANDAFYCSAWSKCVRSALIKDNDIFFDTKLTCEDMDWYYRVILAAKKFAVIDQSFIAYRQREGSVTSSSSIRNLSDFVFVLETWSDRISKAKIDEEIRKTLMGSLAKLYTNLLISYTRYTGDEKDMYTDRIKSLAFLLKFNQNSRVRLISKAYKFCGFRGSVFLLKRLDIVKNKVR